MVALSDHFPVTGFWTRTLVPGAKTWGSCLVAASSSFLSYTFCLASSAALVSVFSDSADGATGTAVLTLLPRNSWFGLNPSALGVFFHSTAASANFV